MPTKPTATQASPAVDNEADGGTTPVIDDALFIREDDSVVDGSHFNPGDRFTKVWVVRNNGTTKWDAGYRLRLVAGPSLGAPLSAPVPETSPGQIASIRVDFQPKEPTDLVRSQWRLANAQGSIFGQPMWTDILVVDPNAENADPDETCPTVSSIKYTLIPMEGADLNHPDSGHGDLNLALRGYIATESSADLIDLSGSTDGGAPKLSGILADGRTPRITGAYQTYDWNWGCGQHGCQGDLIADPEVTLLGLSTSPGEAIRLPSRSAEIFGGGFVAAVLYAEPSRITVAYTRDGTVANGYAVHVEEVCVDPNLLTAYWEGNSGGRTSLPGLRSGDMIGTAAGTEIIVGIRDRGRFMDPRSRKDWW